MSFFKKAAAVAPRFKRMPNLTNAVLQSGGEAALGLGAFTAVVGNPMAGGGYLVAGEREMRMLTSMARTHGVPTKASLGRITKMAQKSGAFLNLTGPELTPERIESIFWAASIWSPQVATEAFNAINPAVIHGKLAGANPIVYNKWLASIANPFSSGIFRHERIHQAHFSNPTHPYFATELAKTPGLEDILRKKFKWGGADAIIDMYKQQAANMSTGPGGAAKAILSDESERLAYSNMDNPVWLQNAKAAGVEIGEQKHQRLVEAVNARRAQLGAKLFTPGMWTAQLNTQLHGGIFWGAFGTAVGLPVYGVVHHFTKAHDPDIEGLRHGGEAAKSRKKHTDFGSGWQGLSKLAEIFSESGGKLRWKGAREFTHFISEGTLSTTVIQKAEGETAAFIATSLEGKTARISSATAFIHGQGHGEAGYEAIADYLFSKTEARELISDVVGGTSPEAEKMWGRMVRRGIAEPWFYGPAGKQKIGWRITPDTLRVGRSAESANVNLQKNIRHLRDQMTTETIMQAGQGNDNTSMLRRSLSIGARGSKKMTPAL